MTNCELFNHAYFATVPILRSCANLDSLANIRCRDNHNILNLSKYNGQHRVLFKRIRSGNYQTRV